ncbi:uncharacterized protein LOC117321455 [Pecten maximus]|uniref:uncharacterized protein LOC117321455 n=1 Tax=Pecten maximus TaxID=6579 RepID=UPI0014587C8E|nr:uncharacterized protein LOC117321455 [Pecten maximus]
MRLDGERFILFPKPKTNLDKCMRWIKACGRPHEQLNVDRINKHKAVCSKHFVGGNGPTAMYPDPIQADGSSSTPARHRPRIRETTAWLNKRKRKIPLEENTEIYNVEPVHNTEEVTAFCDQATQTDSQWVSSMDVLVLSAEIHQLRSTVESQERTIEELKNQQQQSASFGIQEVQAKEDKFNGLVKYYTGITYSSFMALLNFLVPSGSCVNYEKGRVDIKKISNEDGLFLTLCRLRHDFGLKDLAIRFGLTLQSTGVVFNTWIDHMYFKLGQLSIWPYRDTIIENMPIDYRKDFPTSLVIIDGTELKTQTPCALGLQSQFYSDYKSSTTLKCLIGCDPSGSVIFVSELYSGSISDKTITEESGFYKTLKNLKAHGYLNDGDAVMADKGFTIGEELGQLGLVLNIPPFAKSGSQMSPADVKKTQKIAKYRIHIERVIFKIKNFRIVSHTIPVTLFSQINKIWCVC